MSQLIIHTAGHLHPEGHPIWTDGSYRTQLFSLQSISTMHNIHRPITTKILSQYPASSFTMRVLASPHPHPPQSPPHAGSHSFPSRDQSHHPPRLLRQLGAHFHRASARKPAESGFGGALWRDRPAAAARRTAATFIRLLAAR